MKFFKLILLILILALSLLAGCQSFIPMKPLPPSNAPCLIQFAWRGLKPGLSTQTDVLRVLGMPDRIRQLNYNNKSVIEYSYQNGEGYLNQFLATRILFLQDGVVDWIEIPASQKDINFRSIKEINDQIGSFDTVYPNNNYNPTDKGIDVLAGPAYVYISSNCGLAAIGKPYCSLDNDQRMQCRSADEVTQASDDSLQTLYPPPFHSPDPPLTLQSAVFIEIHFVPTTYEGFKENYQYEFTFLGWSFWNKIKK